MYMSYTGSAGINQQSSERVTLSSRADTVIIVVVVLEDDPHFITNYVDHLSLSTTTTALGSTLIFSKSSTLI